MKKFILFGLAVLLFSNSFTQTTWGQDTKESTKCAEVEKDKCDFSEYKPLKNPHSLLKAAIKKVTPEYPVAANFAKIEGEVIVRILVDRKGNVVEACVMEGHPLLRNASIQAAKEWKFKENFGFIDYKPKKKYAETELHFTFKLRE